jgi:8-oxo-dGTP pyrophosphatase MutT (NUDIX family)
VCSYSTCCTLLFAVHDAHGLLLLHCTRKAKKGPHFQLPGGHIDEPEFIAAAGLAPSDYKNQLLKAAKMGAARELYEETGLDFRDSLDRLSPAGLRDDDTRNVFGKTVLKCELEKRLYFFVRVTDDDFWSMVSVDTARFLSSCLSQLTQCKSTCLQKRGIPAKLKGTLIRPLDDEGSHLMVRPCNCYLIIIAGGHNVGHFRLTSTILPP